MTIKKSHEKLSHLNFGIKYLASLFQDKLFPNSKEITESVAALNALKSKFKKLFGTTIDFDNPRTTVYVIGDGKTPRTACTFAKCTNFTVHSIDPEIKIKKYNFINQEKWFDRLYIHKMTSQEFASIDRECELSIIIAVHSHAPFEEFWQRIPGRKIAIAIPCCVKHEITDYPPDAEYEDPYIFSGKNKILVWNKN